MIILHVHNVSWDFIAIHQLHREGLGLETASFVHRQCHFVKYANQSITVCIVLLDFTCLDQILGMILVFLVQKDVLLAQAILFALPALLDIPWILLGQCRQPPTQRVSDVRHLAPLANQLPQSVSLVISATTTLTTVLTPVPSAILPSLTASLALSVTTMDSLSVSLVQSASTSLNSSWESLLVSNALLPPTVPLALALLLLTAFLVPSATTSTLMGAAKNVLLYAPNAKKRESACPA